MAREVSKEEADEILAEVRHKELKTVLQDFPQKGNKEVVSAIEKQFASIKQLADAINNLPEPKINVTVNNDKSEASIKKLGDDILKGLDEVKDLLIMANQPKEVIFTVKRHNYTNYIESVTAKEVNIKPKYQA